MLDDKLGDEAGGAGGGEDESTEVGGALVGESACGVDQGTNTVGLEGRTDEGGTPGGGSRRGFPRLEELLLGVGRLGLLPGLAEERGEDAELEGVVEDGAEGDGGRLNSGEVCDGIVSFGVSLLTVCVLIPRCNY